MTPTHANKQGKRYRYYITHERQRTDRSIPATRIAAPDLEECVLDTRQAFLANDAELIAMLDLHSAEGIQAALDQAAFSSRSLAAHDTQRETVRHHIKRIDVRDGEIEIATGLSALHPAASQTHILTVSFERKRGAPDMKLLISTDEGRPVNRNGRLIQLVVEAHAARRSALQQSGSLSAMAEKQKSCRGRLADMIRLSWLAPDIVTAIMDGTQPASLTRARLNKVRLSPDWNEQRRQLGFA